MPNVRIVEALSSTWFCHAPDLVLNRDPTRWAAAIESLPIRNYSRCFSDCVKNTSVLRYVEPQVTADLTRKMVFLAGPRQCGKTTVAKALLSRTRAPASHYFNWDDDDDRERVLRREWPAGSGLVVFDELHKFSRWRNLLKGLYDKRRSELHILVTGSAKLDYYRRGGDSLQGRYHLLRMHPLSLAELDKTQATLADLLNFGPFPEPFLARDTVEAKRWSREYRTRLVREELASLEHVRELALLELLMLRLPECVGSPLSINALREDLQVSHQSVSRWLNMLENLYAMFRLYPFGAPKLRAVKKEAKHYHFDWTVIDKKGARFESLVAAHLLKWCHWQEDTTGDDVELRYFRDVDGREVDFVILRNRLPVLLVETKLTGQPIDRSLRYLRDRLPKVDAWQVHFSGSQDYLSEDGIRVAPAHVLLGTLV